MRAAETPAWRDQGAFGVVSIRAGGPAESGEALDAAALGQRLGRPDMKGVVLAIGPEPSDAWRGALGWIPAAIENADLPSVAAVRGECDGPLLDAAVSCLFRIAGRSAVFRFPGPAAGRGLADRLAALLPRGLSAAGRIAGRVMPAAEAEIAGVADSISDDGSEVDASLALLGRIVSHVEPRVVRLVMESLNAPRRMGRAGAMRLSASAFCSLASADSLEY